jgi:hypothetical protein
MRGVPYLESQGQSASASGKGRVEEERRPYSARFSGVMNQALRRTPTLHDTERARENLRWD